MKGKIEVSVYQHPTFEEGNFVFQVNPLATLLEQCRKLYEKKNSIYTYPAEEVERQFTQLLQAVSLEKSLSIVLLESDIEWEDLLEKLKRYYPQMVWTQVKKIDSQISEYSFEFIPLVENEQGFPFGTILSQSLIQQGVPGEEDPVSAWEQEIFYIVEDYLKSGLEMDEIGAEVVEPLRTTESFVYNFSEPVVAPDEPKSFQPKTKEPKYSEDVQADSYALNDNQLAAENERLKTTNEQLKKEIEMLNNQGMAIYGQEAVSGNTTVLNKQALYYEEALRRERDAKERIKVTNEKLEHLVSRLERQVMENSLDIIEGEIPYVERSEDWYRKKHIDLIEYDQLYQKAKYLEHTYQVNQRLIVISERLTIGESEMKYERERVNRLKQSPKDIELFVMMDECKMINDRVKIRQGFLWMKPRVVILSGDYENLVEKAAYFDVIQSENQMLERIIDEHVQTEIE